MGRLQRVGVVAVIFFAMATGVLRADWVVGEVQVVDAVGGVNRVTLAGAFGSQGRPGVVSAQVTPEDVAWLRPGRSVFARTARIGGTAWFEGLWPLSEPVGALFQGPESALELVRGNHLRGSWETWPGLTLGGRQVRWAELAEAGAVVLFIPLTEREQPWVVAALAKWEAWARRMQAIPELAEVSWILVSTVPETDVWSDFSSWVRGREPGFAPEVVSFGPTATNFISAALEIPVLVGDAGEVWSLPLIWVVDRRGTLQARWQGWGWPLDEGERLLRDLGGRVGQD